VPVTVTRMHPSGASRQALIMRSCSCMRSSLVSCYCVGMDLMRGITGILLAAGSGRRFGGDKQSALLHGVPLLRRAAQALVDAGLVEPIVVLASDRVEHRNLLAGLGVRIVENPEAATGMASSLQAGLHAAMEAHPEAALVAVCDQPAMSGPHLRALAAAWRESESSMVASGYAGTYGVPALFAAKHFAELCSLQGDRGAGRLLSAHADKLSVVPLAGGERDIDTAAGLSRL